MAGSPELTLHRVPFSHPCLAVSAALDRFGYEYEAIDLPLGKQGDDVEAIYGEGRRTVPGMLIDGEPVHGSEAIMARIDEMTSAADLFPEPVRQALAGPDAELPERLQTAARVLTFGSLHFRPEALGTFPGGEPLDPAGTDFAIRMIRGAWKYVGIDAQRIADSLAALPGLLDRVDALVAAGAAGGEEPTALDFLIGSSLHLLIQIGDVRPLIEARPAAHLATAWFEPGKADIPAGALPAGWVPAA